TEVDPFFFALDNAGSLPPGQEVIGKKRNGDSWNFVLGMDMNQFIRWLNPQNSFFFSTQFFYKHLNGAVKRGATISVNGVEQDSYQQLRQLDANGAVFGTVQEGEVLPVP